MILLWIAWGGIPQLNKVLKEENINLLREMIPQEGDVRAITIVEGCQDYLLRLKELYAMCVRYLICLTQLLDHQLYMVKDVLVEELGKH